MCWLLPSLQPFGSLLKTASAMHSYLQLLANMFTYLTNTHIIVKYNVQGQNWEKIILLLFYVLFTVKGEVGKVAKLVAQLSSATALFPNRDIPVSHSKPIPNGRVCKRVAKVGQHTLFCPLKQEIKLKNVMERLIRGHLHSKLEVPRLTCLDRESNPGLRSG
jgi:hypothetical protein